MGFSKVGFVVVSVVVATSVFANHDGDSQHKLDLGGLLQNSGFFSVSQDDEKEFDKAWFSVGNYPAVAKKSGWYDVDLDYIEPYRPRQTMRIKDDLDISSLDIQID